MFKIKNKQKNKNKTNTKKKLTYKFKKFKKYIKTGRVINQKHKLK